MPAVASSRPPGRPALPLPASEIIDLYEKELWSFEDIGSRYGVCVATARNHYRRARPGIPSRNRGTRSRKEQR